MKFHTRFATTALALMMAVSCAISPAFAASTAPLDISQAALTNHAMDIQPFAIPKLVSHSASLNGSKIFVSMEISSPGAMRIEARNLMYNSLTGEQKEMISYSEGSGTKLSAKLASHTANYDKVLSSSVYFYIDGTQVAYQLCY